MNTYIVGHRDDSIIIVRNNKQEIIPCKDAIVKLWLSSGTVLGIKYGKGLIYKDIWKIRVLNGPMDSRYIHVQCFDKNDPWHSDRFETEEEVINWKVIPRTHYTGPAI